MPGPSPGLSDFWATVHVKLREPLYDGDDPSEPPSQGYFAVFGVRAAPARLQNVLDDEIKDGIVDWDDSEWHLVEPTALDRATRSRISQITGEGIWFRSAKVFYADTEVDTKPG